MSLHEPTAHKPRRITASALMWISGAAILILLAVAMAVLYGANRPQFLAMGTAMVSLFLVGKEASIPLGLSLGGNPVLIATGLILLDSASILILEPFVHTTLQKLSLRPNFLGRTIQRIEKRAAAKHVLVEKYGAPGLYLFLLIPFAFNFPLVGAVIGRMVGLRRWKTMAAILAAITTTGVAWTVLISYGFSQIANINPYVPVAMSVIMTLAVLTAGAIAGWKEKRQLAEKLETPTAATRAK